MAIVKRQSKTSVRPSSRSNKKAVKPIGNKRVAKVVIVKKGSEDTGDIQLIEKEINTNGTFYAPEGYAFKSVKVEIKEFVAPGVTLSVTPSTTMYDKDVDTLGEIAITANIKKGTNDINTVRFAINGTTVKEITEDVKDGGVFLYTHTFDPRTNTTFTISVTAFDSQTKTGASSKEIKFVNKTYYGTVASTVVNPTPEEITALEHTLTGTKAYVYSGINMDYGKVVYAYPAAYGSISKVMDTINNLNYTDSFTKTTVSINGTSYYVYTLTDPSGADDIQLSFS